MLLLSNEFLKDLNFTLKVKISLHRINKFRHCSYDHLKYGQIMCLKLLLKEQHLIAVLATGFGKSLIFEVLPYFVSITTNEFPLVVIVEPLNVILHEQHAKYGDKSIIINNEVTKALLNSSCEGDVKNYVKDSFGIFLVIQKICCPTVCGLYTKALNGHYVEYLSWWMRLIVLSFGVIGFEKSMVRLDYYVLCYHEQLC